MSEKTSGEILNVPLVGARLNGLLDKACEQPTPDGWPRTLEIEVGDLRQFVGAALWAWERDLEARYAIGDYIGSLGNKYGGETREETESRQFAALQRYALYRGQGAAQAEAYAALIAAAPKMYDALAAVNRLIAEAAMTGFNCHDGDWAQRLYDSQQETSTALREAGLRPPQGRDGQDDIQGGR